MVAADTGSPTDSVQAAIPGSQNDDTAAQVEESQLSVDETPVDEPAKPRSLFPLNVFAWSPTLDRWLPAPFKNIQSLSHLVLFIGILGSYSMLIDTIYSWQTYGCRAGASYCQSRIFPLFFVGCCAFYFSSTIQQYDSRLYEKKKQIEEQQGKVHEMHESMIGALDSCLQRSMGTEVSFAEQQFDSHRKDFVRFLTRYGNKLGNGKGGGAFLEHFRTFVLQWLEVFAEASVDPVNKPLRLVTREELAQLDSAMDVNTLVLDRVKECQVAFLAAQAEADREEVEQMKSSWKNLSGFQNSARSVWQSMVGDGNEQQQQDVVTLEDGRMHVETKPVEYRWVSWACTGTEALRDPESSKTERNSVFPIKLSLGIVTICLVNMDHVKLILGFFIGGAILCMELFFLKDEGMKMSLVVEVSLCMFALAFVLYEFLDLDIIQQLEKEIAQLKEQQEAVRARAQKMKDFYGGLQRLADVWIHRCLTRLSILKEVHCLCGTLRPNEAGRVLSSLNPKLADVEDSLPPLENWVTEGQMTDEEQKGFDSTLQGLALQLQTDLEDDQDKALASMDKAINVMKAMRDHTEIKELEEKPKMVQDKKAVREFEEESLPVMSIDDFFA